MTWYQSDGAADSIYANIYSNSSWGTATLLESSDEEANGPLVVSNGAGYLVTDVWARLGFGE